jgi:hypothetical protein
MKLAYPLLGGLLGVLVLALPALAAEKTVVGWIEKVRLYPGNFLVHAKLDSGAQSCSLDASNVQIFSRGGQKWVRFDLEERREGKKLTIERPLVRWAPIKRHNDEPQRRPVIKLGVCLGQIYKETEVNLVDRTNYQYPMLIGRKFMQGVFAIDPAAKYTVEPNCQEPANLE